MPQFRSLKELEKYVSAKLEKTINSRSVEDVFQDAMQEAVEEQVYEAYKPDDEMKYDRREDNGGLSDKSNMLFTTRTKQGKTYVSLFENLTVGSNASIYGHETDSMNGHFISDLIENGSNNQHTSPANSENGWYDPSGEWADPRPFARYTAMMLSSEPTYNKRLKEILKKGINS